MTFKALFAAIVLAGVLTLSAAYPGRSAAEWIMGGSNPTSYEMGIAPGGGQNRGPAGYLKSREPVKGFGTMMQQFAADDYLGRRVRFSASVRTENVAGWAGIWMRTDSADRTGLTFDNMEDRPIKGTTGWTPIAVVLDVPASATRISFGVLVSGEGAAWLDNVKFEAVPSSVPTTEHKVAPLKGVPGNLDFSAPIASR
jgi:hypothetical protein